MNDLLAFQASHPIYAAAIRCIQRVDAMMNYYYDLEQRDTLTVEIEECIIDFCRDCERAGIEEDKLIRDTLRSEYGPAARERESKPVSKTDIPFGGFLSFISAVPFTYLDPCMMLAAHEGGSGELQISIGSATINQWDRMSLAALVEVFISVMSSEPGLKGDPDFFNNAADQMQEMTDKLRNQANIENE